MYTTLMDRSPSGFMHTRLDDAPLDDRGDTIFIMVRTSADPQATHVSEHTNDQPPSRTSRGKRTREEQGKSGSSHSEGALPDSNDSKKPSSTGARDGQNTQTALDADLNDAHEGMANGAADMEVEPARAETLSTVMTRASVWLRARRSIVVWRVQRDKAR